MSKASRLFLFKSQNVSIIMFCLFCYIILEHSNVCALAKLAFGMLFRSVA